MVVSSVVRGEVVLSVLVLSVVLLEVFVLLVSEAFVVFTSIEDEPFAIDGLMVRTLSTV